MPHAVQDRQLGEHTADYKAFTERPSLAELLEHAVNTVMSRRLTSTARFGKHGSKLTDGLNARAEALRTRGTQLGRTETIPTTEWHRPTEVQLQGTDLYTLWLTVIQQRPDHEVAIALANVAKSRMVAHAYAVQRTHRNIR